MQPMVARFLLCYLIEIHSLTLVLVLAIHITCESLPLAGRGGGGGAVGIAGLLPAPPAAFSCADGLSVGLGLPAARPAVPVRVDYWKAGAM